MKKAHIPKSWRILKQNLDIKISFFFFFFFTFLNDSTYELENKGCKPNDGGFDAKCIDPNVDDPEKAISIIRPSGSHAAP